MLHSLYEEAEATAFDSHAIHLRLSAANLDRTSPSAPTKPRTWRSRIKRGTVRGRGANQAKYLHQIATHDINFGIGPAGTGKTFLAVASAVEALNEIARAALDPGAPGGGSRRKARLPARRSQPEGGPLPAPAATTRCMKCSAWRRWSSCWRRMSSRLRRWPMRGRTLNDASRDPGRGPEHHHRADEDVPDPPGFRLDRRGDRRSHPDRFAQAREVRPARRGRGAARVSTGEASPSSKARDVVRHPLVARIVNAYEKREDSDRQTRATL